MKVRKFTPATPGSPLSLRAFARLIKVDERSVRKAVGRRLKASVGRNRRGSPVIVDVDLARREWDLNRTRITTADRTLPAAPSAVVQESARCPGYFEIANVAVSLDEDGFTLGLGISLPLEDLERELDNGFQGEGFVVAELNEEQARGLARTILQLYEGSAPVER